MLRATFKSLLSRKARLLLSGIAVILGVTFISGSLVLNASLGKSVESMFSTVFDDVDVQVTAEADGASPYGEIAPIPESVVAEIDAVDGVSETTGLVQDGTGLVRVVGKNGKVPPMMGAPTIGQNWTGTGGALELRDGRGPEADGEIVVNETLADATGYEIGDTIPILTLAPEPVEYEVVGIAGYSGARGSIAGEQSIWFTLDTARSVLMTTPDSYTNIMVDADPGVGVNELRDRLADALGGDYTVQTGAELAEEQSTAFQSILSFFNYLLLGFGAVALIVSVFLIVNTFSIIVAQRTRELALFRAMGASRGQVTGSVLLEAFVIGLFSAVIGFALGIGVGYLGTTLLAGTAGESLDATLEIPLSAALAAVGVGIGVTMIAAILPAINASRIPPIAALRDAAATVRPVRWFAIIGGLMLVAGGGLLWAGLSGGLGDGDNRLLGILGATGLLFIGAAIFTPVLAKPLVSAIGRLVSFSLPGKLGRRNSARNPRRTAITASALMIGIALVTTVGVLLSSAQASMAKFFDENVSADILIAGAQTGMHPPTFSPEVLTETRDLPDVNQVVGIYADTTRLDGQDMTVYAVDDLAAYVDLLGDKVSDGDVAGFGADDIALYPSQAEQFGVDVGDSVDVSFSAAEEPVTLTVAVILDADMDGLPVVSADHADAFTLSSPAQAFVQLNDGADKGDVIEEINGLLDSNPEVSAADMSAFTDQITQIFDVILLVVQILLGLAIFIAIIGVVNTLTLSVLERTRELGLLRAIGMTRGQVTRMVTVESVVISLFGSLLGLGIGAGLGIAVQQALKDDFVDVLAMPWGTMAFYLVAAVVIGVLAAMIPAYRANRLNVLNAISHE
ncbi:ABC transporter permease [Stackebrandtia soli]|uniref:ABC transporter permease n=1 Tax=Stackebrandtia soli TaxID=1892856 RepID=UPI0039E7FBBF